MYQCIATAINCVLKLVHNIGIGDNTNFFLWEPSFTQAAMSTKV